MNENQKTETVTISRDVYDVLVATYKARDAEARAYRAWGEVPMLHADQVAELDQH